MHPPDQLAHVGHAPTPYVQVGGATHCDQTNTRITQLKVCVGSFCLVLVGLKQLQGRIQPSISSILDTLQAKFLFLEYFTSKGLDVLLPGGGMEACWRLYHSSSLVFILMSVEMEYIYVIYFCEDRWS